MNIEHVAMYVKDLDRAKTFFEKYFGAKSNDLYYNKNTGFKSYFLTFDDGARLEIMNKPDLSDGQREMGYAHIAFAVGSKEKVDQMTELLRKDGYNVVSNPRTTGDGYYESVIADMEGNKIEITI